MRRAIDCGDFVARSGGDEFVFLSSGPNGRNLAVLAEAIVQGGSTLRDFIGVNGQSGYFQQTYFTYNRAGKPCRVCGAPIRQIVQGQRSTFYCVNCQK